MQQSFYLIKSSKLQLVWTGLVWSGLVWTRLVWAGLDWTGLDWAGLGWAGLVWSGLDWAGLVWTGLDWDRNWIGPSSMSFVSCEQSEVFSVAFISDERRVFSMLMRTFDLLPLMLPEAVIRILRQT